MDRSISLSLFVLILALTYTQGDVVEYRADYHQPLDLICSNAPKGDKTVTWFKDTVAVVAKENEYEIIAENYTLRIVKLEPKVLGAFVCKYNGSMGEMAFSIKVRPYVTAFDKSRNVIQGDPLRLDCKAWGVPEPVVTWSRDSVPLLSDGSGTITLKPWGGNAGDPFPKLENGTIRIVDMDYKDAGNYTCLVTSSLLNANGEFLTVNATVLVQVKDKYAALWPFLGICVEVAVLCTIILIYERRRAKRIEEEERLEEAAHLNANNESRPVPGGEEVRQRK